MLIAAGTALTLGVLIAPVVIHAQDDGNDGIHDQLPIMTKILEASIGKDSIDHRLHSSVFDSKIRAEYIPTVGAIFTIPINFPLHPSEDEEGDEPEEAFDDDLWEHFSDSSKNASSAATVLSSQLATVFSSQVKDLMALEVLDAEEKLEKYRDALGDDAHVHEQHEDPAEQHLESVRSYLGDIPLLGVLERGVFSRSMGGGKPYDPVKVSTLTHTIIQTMAHYGHRLKSLPNAERVLVVLEAPGPKGSAATDFYFERAPHVRSPEEPSGPGGMGAKGGMGGLGTKEKKATTSAIERRLTVRMGGRDGMSTFWIPPVSRQIERDHRLLAFKKSDLKKEESYDSIKGKVETTDY